MMDFRILGRKTILLDQIEMFKSLRFIQTSDNFASDGFVFDGYNWVSNGMMGDLIGLICGYF